MSYRHQVAVRYGECDMQGIVFNAHYLAYADDAVGRWFEAALPAGTVYVAGNSGASFDVLVKRAALTWASGCTYGDVIELECRITRWGVTSFDVEITGTVAGSHRFDLTLTYVSVVPGTHTPCPVPGDVRTALG